MAEETRSFLKWAATIHVLGALTVAVGLTVPHWDTPFYVTVACMIICGLTGGHIRRNFLSEPPQDHTVGKLKRRAIGIAQGNEPMIQAFESRLRQASLEMGRPGWMLVWLSRTWVGLCFLACVVVSSVFWP
jgi:hypothetical protein